MPGASSPRSARPTPCSMLTISVTSPSPSEALRRSSRLKIVSLPVGHCHVHCLCEGLQLTHARLTSLASKARTVKLAGTWSL